MIRLPSQRELGSGIRKTQNPKPKHEKKRQIGNAAVLNLGGGKPSQASAVSVCTAFRDVSQCMHLDFLGAPRMSIILYAEQPRHDAR